MLHRFSFLLLAAIPAGCAGPEPSWVREFGYAPEQVFSFEIGAFGCPRLPIRFVTGAIEDAGSSGPRDSELVLPFDTGNTVGLSVSTVEFDRLGLRTTSSHSLRDSSGRTRATLRIGRVDDVVYLGRRLGPTRVFEHDNARLPGLAGPVLLDGGHMTLDYGAQRLAVAPGALPTRIPGYRSLPLVRSRRHPVLVLVRGTIEGSEVLIQLDTGKSRTVVNPGLARDLALPQSGRGVRIGDLRIGGHRFEVRSAKEVDQTGIDPDLSSPILIGAGADVLSRLVWTVDYEGGVLWLPDPK